MTNAGRVAGLVVLMSLVCGVASRAQTGRRQQRRFVDRQGRAYFAGPLRATLGGGVALYSGDLGSSLKTNFPGLSVSAGLLYRLQPHVLIGAEGSYFRVGSRDQLPERNLAFRADNGLGTVFVRVELLPDNSVFVSSRQAAPLLQPYLKAGVGGLLYSPRSYSGPARPTASTGYFEPERNDYPALAGVLPLGAGLSLRAGERLRLSLEGAYYFTTTDHLDDVSARGNASQKDGFGTAELKLEYQLGE